MTTDDILQRVKILGYLPEEQVDLVVSAIKEIERDSVELRRTIDGVLEALPDHLHCYFLVRMMKG